MNRIKNLFNLLVLVSIISVVIVLAFTDMVPMPGERLTIAIIPAEDPAAMLAAFEPARQYLEKELGMEIETYKATDYGAVVEAMRVGKVDVAFFGPFSFVQAAERANARAIIAGAGPDGKLDVYHSILITHRDSGLKNVDDVKARAGELTLSFVDPGSTSGHLVPRGYMEHVGINVDEDFKEIIFAGGHEASVLAVGARKVDLGATWEGPFERAIEEGVIRPDDVSVIWKSDPIPSWPVAVRGDMDEALIQRIQQAFLDMPQKDPDAFAQFEATWQENVGYVAVTCADYEFVRQLAIGLGKL